MYNPPHFEETRPEELERIMAGFPLGALVYLTTDGLDAAHLPFMYKKEDGTAGKLIAHVARKNPVWQQVANESEVLIILDVYKRQQFRPADHGQRAGKHFAD